MKKRQLITSVSLAVMVLFSILFQSIHSYEHIAKQLSVKQCHHDYSDSNGEMTHQHHDYETCFVCNFAFGGYIIPHKFALEFHSLNKEIPYLFALSEKVFSISESICLVRGPPAVLVF